MRISIPFTSPVTQKLSCARGMKALAVLAVALAGAQLLTAQTPAAPPATAPAHKAIHRHPTPTAAHSATPPAPAAPAPVLAKEPETPHWPANERAHPAAVTWDSQGLRIEAANSSLQQILNDVSTATGAKVEGLGADERVFGAYGPGQVRDVLSKLLQGSAYNVIMIGDQGQGAPRQIVLTSRNSTGAQAPTARRATDADDDDSADSDADEPQQAPPPIQPGFVPGNSPRSPQPLPQMAPHN
jgi:hypothetical protein